MWCSAALVLLAVLYPDPAVAGSEDVPWPEYRGPEANGHVDADLPVRWSETEGVLYKRAIPGRAWSTPVVDGDSIWMTTAPEDGRHFGVLQLSLSTGDILREVMVFTTDSPEKVNRLNSYASPSPVLESGRLYVHFGTYGTAAINTKDGTVIWRRDDLKCDHMEGPGSSLVLWNDLLLFHLDGCDRQSVVALDKNSGEPVWITDRSQPLDSYPPDLRKAYGTPIVAKIDDRMQLVGSGAHYAFGYDVASGDELWHMPLQGFSMSARPALAHGHVYLNTGFFKARIVALKLGGEGRLSDEARTWEYTKNVPTMSSHIVVGDELYMVHDGGVATCLDAHTGESIWRERLPGQYCASPLYNRGHLYFFSREGHGVVVRAGREFEIIATNELEDGFMASPVVVDDTLLLRAKQHLYRIGEHVAVPEPTQPEEQVPWPEYRGPQGNGHTEGNLPIDWSETDNVLYKTPLPGRGWSTPVVVGANLWMTTAPEGGHNFRALKVDLATGQLLEDILLFETDEPQFVNRLNSYASPSPVAEPGRVYVHFGTYGTAAIDTTDGSILWRRDDIHCDHMQGPGSSPVLWEDLLLFHMDGGDVQYVIALDTETGDSVWSTDRSQPIAQLHKDLRKAYSTPLIAEVDGTTQLISAGAQYTFGYDPESGDELWHAAVAGFSMSARPSFGHGHAYLNSGFNKARLVALKLGGSGELGDDCKTWEYTKNVPTMSSHILVGDEIFMVDDGGIATCLDAHTGERLWRERISGQYSASPIYNNGHVYFFSREGLGTILAASREFKVVATNELSDGLMASPVVVGDDLILRAKEHIYRIGKPEAQGSDG